MDLSLKGDESVPAVHVVPSGYLKKAIVLKPGSSILSLWVILFVIAETEWIWLEAVSQTNTKSISSLFLSSRLILVQIRKVFAGFAPCPSLNFFNIRRSCACLTSSRGKRILKRLVCHFNTEIETYLDGLNTEG